MKNLDNYFELLYPRREIGVSHYPMASSPISNSDLSSLNFLETNEISNKKGMLLYFHIPFCDKICSFCPYNKIKFDESKVDKYLNALLKEMGWYKSKNYISKSKIDAIYFGGGTPSILTSEQLIDLLNQIKEGFDLSPEVEITIEGNPHKFTEDKLFKLFDKGVNRISLGIQTFSDEIGQLIEIPHTSDEAITVISKIKTIGFPNLSIDLMYNLPAQTMESWKKDLEKAISLKIDHITLFPLVVVPETKLFQRIKSGELSIGNLREELEMFQFASEFLTSNGYHQESTYDFALPNKSNNYGEKHFKDRYDLLGLGMGSFGEINNYCYINNGRFDDYIISVENNQLPILLQNFVSEEDKIYSILAMGLRTLEVNLSKFDHFNINPFSLFPNQLMKLTENNLIEISNGKIKLTDKGKLWGNNICKEFYSEEYKKSLPAWQRMEELARNKTNLQEA
jgi:oxygen-independent coproporphyrinogen-3 oxidase